MSKEKTVAYAISIIAELAVEVLDLRLAADSSYSGTTDSIISDALHRVEQEHQAYKGVVVRKGKQ